MYEAKDYQVAIVVYQDPLCTRGLLHATYPSLTVEEMEPFEPVWENLQLDTNRCLVS